MQIKKANWTGIGFGLLLVLTSMFFIGKNSFFFIIGTGVFVAVLPFVISIIQENRSNTEKEEMFLEFARNLVESVEAGIPISKSIVNVKDKPYGALSKHVQKLANQIQIGIPLNSALEVFAKDVGNKTVSRAITLIGQAERSGGNIGKILEAVAEAVNTSDKLKKEREAAVSTLVVQGYIIFIVFMIIVLIMQFKILPMVSGIANIGTVGADIGASAGGGIDQGALSRAFLYMLLVQGLFTGLTIGKISEGSVKSGIKHSFALMAISFLVSSVSTVFFG